MKNKLFPLIDKVLLRKRSLPETVNAQLKNICQIEHSRHRSVTNFLVNLMAGLSARPISPRNLLSTTACRRIPRCLGLSWDYVALRLIAGLFVFTDHADRNQLLTPADA